VEYEIKLLGQRKDLSGVFRKFMDSADSIRDRSYSFNTYYLDHKNKFYDSGYSLRYRTGQLEAGYSPGTEIKALAGDVDGVSARIEIGHKGKDPLVSYFNMMSDPEYPADAPKIAPNLLGISFATAVRRQERRAIVHLPTKPVIVEAALDDIAILRQEGRSGAGLFDVVLYPHAHEDELELELKTLTRRQEIDDTDLKHFMEWASQEVIGEHKDVVSLTTVSKAVRAYEHIHGAPSSGMD
jgi:hypothetical protein